MRGGRGGEGTFNGRIGDVRVKVMLKREDENCRVLIDYKVTGLILDRLST